MTERRKRVRLVVALLGVFGLVAVGCGSDDGGGSAAPSTTASKPSANAHGVKGCEHGHTDPSDLSADRQVARCEPGAPAPKPLAEPATVTFASQFKLEFMSPVLLADSMGEFKKENITFKFVNLPFADAVPQLAQGAVDVGVGGIEGALFNAGEQGLGVKLVVGNYWPKDAGDYDVPQTGLWCRRDKFSQPSSPDFSEVENMSIGTSVGKGSSSIYYSSEMLSRRAKKQVDLAKADIRQVPSSDMVTALKNGAIDCGILLDPLWIQVKDDPAFVQAATQTPGEPLGGLFFGKSMLVDKPDVGEAFLRAVIRTINTYFAGDYHKNAETVAAIAKAIDQPVENVTRTPSLLMDWEIREGTTDRMQKLFIRLGVLQFKTPVPEKDVVDRGPYSRAVGWA